MTLLLLISLLTLPFLAQIRLADAGCCGCCCCPSCCCKPIIIKLPPPPVKLCPCCCGCGCCCCKPCCCCCCKPCCCCCCKPCCCCCPCCCCGGGGGRKRRSVVDLMARKFSDVLLPQQNHDAIMGMGGCGGGAVGQGVSLSPLHTLCSQIPPAQRGPACQQITQQFPLSQNIFNHQPGMLGAGGDGFDCPNCAGGNCAGGACRGCQGGQGQAGGCAGCAGGQCQGGMCSGGGASGAFHIDGSGDPNTFNLAQLGAGSPCGGALGGRRKRRALFLRDALAQQNKAPTQPGPLVFPKGVNAKKEDGETKRTAPQKREVKNQLVFRNNLEFVLRQSPLMAPSVTLL